MDATLLKLTEQDAEKIMIRVQEVLRTLDRTIVHDGCKTESHAQRTAGGPKNEFHYLYRAYYCREYPDSEGVVVGVSINASDNHYLLEGDIGGEETGHTYFEIPSINVDGEFENLLNASEEIAKQLVQQSAVLSKAIAEHRTAPDAFRNSPSQ